MDIEKINNLRNRIFEELKGYDIQDVIYFDAMRYSGITRRGLTIRKTTEQVMPCYLFEDDEDIEDAEEKVTNFFSKLVKAKPTFVITLQSKTNYQNRLSTIPYREMLDMIVVVKYTMENIDNIVKWNVLPSSFKDVTYDDLKTFDITEQKLFKKAYDTTRVIFEEYFGKLSEILPMYVDEAQEDLIDEEVYFLSNKLMMFGANVILYDENLRRIYKVLGKNYYIIPCNIHHLFVIPEDFPSSKNMMLEMVKWVNTYTLPEEEYLSDSLFYYNNDTKKLELVEEDALI